MATIPSKSICNSANTTSPVTYPPYPALPAIVPEEIGIVTEEDPETGSGQFDRYMRAGTNQLQIQYDLGRIKGPDFAIAFVALQELMMVQGNKFILDKYTAEVMAHKTYLEIDEIREKGKLERKSIELNILKGEMELRHLELQMDKTKNEAQLICTQEEELRKNGEVNRRKTEEEIDLIERQETELKLNGTENRLKTKEEVLKIKEEIDLLQTQDSELKSNGTVERALKGAQTSTQGAQASLYGRQVTGYDEKNKNENAKMLLDAWAVQAVEEPDPSQYKILNLASPKIDPLVDSIKSGTGL